MDAFETAEFSRDLRRSREIGLLMSGSRARNLWERAHGCRSLDGEFWECGVYRGGSANLIVGAAAPKVLRLFDTFAGFPRQIGEHDMLGFDFHGWPAEPGILSASPCSVLSTLHPFHAQIHKGVVPESFAGLEDSRVAFAHLDMDLYEPTLRAMEFIWPRLVEGGALVIDDYGSEWTGVTMAVHEKFGQAPAGDGQCTLIKAERPGAVELKQEAGALA